MSLEHAILGFLNYQPYSGYDLKKIFDTSIQHFWQADQSQIYRVLNSLEESGYAQMEIIHQEDRPDRKVYHITDHGREELLNWVASPPPMSSPRSAPLIQVFFAGQMSDDQILAKFEQFAALMRAVLERYQDVPDLIGPFQAEIPSEREHFFWMLTLDSGIRNMRANLEWAENTIKRIQAGELPPD
jgi:DNA-binding PadR family transcriptional regulator